MSEIPVTRDGVQGLVPSITYIREGKSTEIVMSMGLLNKLLQAVGNYANVAMVGLDPYFNEIVLKKALTLRDHKGRPINEQGSHLDANGARVKEVEEVEDIDITPDDAGRILLFCQAHMVDFTYRATIGAGHLNSRTEEARKLLSAAMPGSSGSASSTSKTPAASPST